MTLPSGLSSFLGKDTLTIAGLILALAVAIATILKYRAETRKLRAETKKIESDALAAERDKRKSERERVQDCARNILQSVSATVDELFATFFLFAYPPEYVSGEKLQEAIRVARRFRHEQRYRVEIENLMSELASLAHGTHDEALARLHSLMLGLLTRITEKKTHVANIDAGGLTGENAAAVARWLDEIRDIQVAIGLLIGDISGRLALSQNNAEKIECAA